MSFLVLRKIVFKTFGDRENEDGREMEETEDEERRMKLVDFDRTKLDRIDFFFFYLLFSLFFGKQKLLACLQANSAWPD